MREQAFRSWLSDIRQHKGLGTPLELGTINCRIANCRRVEYYEGDLDQHFDQDRCLGLLARLSYSREDERRNRPALHQIPIDGNVHNGTATLRHALGLYKEFREAQSHRTPNRQPRLVRPVGAARAVAVAQPPDEANDEHTRQPSEQHFTIQDGATGYSYEQIIGPYLRGAKEITVEDPYIRATHQVENFIRFCETLMKLGNVRRINLVTGFDDDTRRPITEGKLTELKQSLLDRNVSLDIRFDNRKHDREIRFDNGWVIKIGRGLDFYQRPSTRFGIGALDLSLRRCFETKVDIFKP